MALTGLWLKGQKYFGATGNAWEEKGDLAVFSAAAAWLDAYWAGDAPEPTELPLAPAGTAFQSRVWQCLLDISYGQTVTYGQLAQMVGCGSPRAIGGAVGRNPISIIIPCHRVVGITGQLTGYAGGVECKRFLLEHEEVSRQE